MRLITGTSVLLYISGVLAFLVPLLKQGAQSQLAFQFENLSWKQWGLALPVVLGFYALAFAMHLEAASGFLYFLAGLAGYILLGAFPFAQPGMRGALLLLIVLAFTGTIPEASAVQLPLISILFGLTIGRFVSPNTAWEDYWLPASWCIGTVWIAVGGQESLLTAYQSILAIFLSIVLLLRTLQSLPLLPEKNPIIRPAFVTLVAGLAAWLCIQTMVIQPSLLKWAWLLAGGSLLSFLLVDGPEETDSTKESQLASLLRGANQLVLIGIAALVASRLFGTLGWVILAVGLLANVRTSKVATIAALFFLGRSLLQVFILQYNPNVTGINITHPYASAALYVGFVVMLLLPTVINILLPSKTSNTQPVNWLAWALLPFAAVFTGVLSNYFVHAEATGSLLVALTVSGLGVALVNAAAKPVGETLLLFPMLTMNSALLAHELLYAGTEAEKSQKIMVLGAVLLVMLVVGTLLSRGVGSGRNPVQVS